jgi:tetratricopeptide (TPR) repeat protein
VLRSALADAAAGRGRSVVVIGEAGTGKSRLCAELAGAAAAAGIMVRRAAGQAHTATDSLVPILALARGYFGVEEDDAAAEVRRKIAARIVELDRSLEADLPAVFELLGVAEPQAPRPWLDPKARQQRMVEVFRVVSQRRASESPLLLLLEDLHWFDPDSVRFLGALLPVLAGARTLVLGNCRPEFARAGADMFHRQIALDPLDGTALREMVEDLLGTHPTVTPLSAEVIERSGGNPLFVEEIVRSLVTGGALAGARGRYVLAGDATVPTRVPPTVHAVLASRIDALDPTAKTVLQTAAVVGRTFTEAILRSVPDVDGPSVARALAVGCERELIQQTPRAGEYRFWHPLTQEVAYAGLRSTTRARLHKGVAEAVLARAPDRHDELAALVAGHYEAAGEHLEAARWQVRAGLRAALTDYSDAVRRMRAAVAHATAAPRSRDADAVEVRARALLLRFGARTGLPAAEAERALAEARAAAQRLDDPMLRSLLTNSEATFLNYRGNAGAALAAYTRSIPDAEAAGHAGVRAMAWAGTGIAHANAGPLDEGIAQVERAIEICAGDVTVGTDLGGYSLLDAAHSFRSQMLMFAGRLDEARSAFDAALAAFDVRPMAEWRCWLLTMHAELALWTGLERDLRRAETDLAVALALAADSGDIPARVRTRQMHGVLHLLRGDPPAAAGRIRDALDDARTHVSGLREEAAMLAHLAMATLESSTPAAALPVAEEAVAVARAKGAHVVESLAQLVRGRVLRHAGTSAAETAEAHAAISAGLKLACDNQARCYAAFGREELACLDPSTADWCAVADGYAAIGAHGHAERVRAQMR